MMLFYKAWLESRVRFFAGVLVTIGICLIYIRLHLTLIPGWIMAMGQPNEPKPWWLELGIKEYGFYLWHFLYENKLQQALVLFAVLFGLGGLSRERVTGAALFSLGLPVSRRKWLVTRAAVAMMQSGLLGLCAVLVIMIASTSINQTFSWVQIVSHCLLLVAGLVLFTGFGVFLSMISRGEQIVQISFVALFFIPYVVFQELNRGPHSHWQNFLNVSSVLAGPWHLTSTTVPWTGLMTTWVIAAALLWISVLHGDRVDY